MWREKIADPILNKSDDKKKGTILLIMVTINDIIIHDIDHGCIPWQLIIILNVPFTHYVILASLICPFFLICKKHSCRRSTPAYFRVWPCIVICSLNSILYLFHCKNLCSPSSESKLLAKW